MLWLGLIAQIYFNIIDTDILVLKSVVIIFLYAVLCWYEGKAILPNKMMVILDCGASGKRDRYWEMPESRCKKSFSIQYVLLSHCFRKFVTPPISWHRFFHLDTGPNDKLDVWLLKSYKWNIRHTWCQS